jgi:hypothetical protein
VIRFKSGNFSTCDAPRSGRHKPDIIDQIHELILEDHPISSEQLGISRERVGSIIHEDLDMLKLCSEWSSEMSERGSETSKVPVV